MCEGLTRDSVQANGYQTKTASGLQAVQWIKEGKWDLVESYCMMDTKLTREISVQSNPPVLLPLSWCRRHTGIQAFLEHEYCDISHVHRQLQVSVKERSSSI